MPIHNQVFHAPSGSPTLDIAIGIPAVLATTYSASNTPIPSPISGRALIDTGASGSAVDKQVIGSLGIQPIGQVPIATPTQATGLASVFRVKVSFPQSWGGETEWSVIGCELAAQGIIALIGRDVLANCILIYNGPAATFTFTF